MILSVVVRVQGGHFTDFSVAGVTVDSLGLGVGTAQTVQEIPSTFLAGMHRIKSMNFYYRCS